MDAYAPFLFDAAIFWALTVNRTLQENADPKNGTHIFYKIVKDAQMKFKAISNLKTQILLQ